MKTRTKIITLLASIALLTACGNNQKAEDCFTNSKEPQTEQTTQSTETTKTSEKTETSAEQTTQSTETTQTTETTETTEQAPVGVTPALQPTFEIKYIGMAHTDYGRIGTYTVIHRPTGDKVYKALTEEQAKAFCNYMEEIAHGKENLNYSMTQNFEYWLKNH